MRGQEIDAALLAANTDPSRIPPNCEAGGLQLTDGTVAISARPARLVDCPEPKNTSHCQIRDCLRTTLGRLLAQNKIPPSISHGFHKRGRERNPTKTHKNSTKNEGKINSQNPLKPLFSSFSLPSLDCRVPSSLRRFPPQTLIQRQTEPKKKKIFTRSKKPIPKTSVPLSVKSRNRLTRNRRSTPANQNPKKKQHRQQQQQQRQRKLRNRKNKFLSTLDYKLHHRKLKKKSAYTGGSKPHPGTEEFFTAEREKNINRRGKPTQTNEQSAYRARQKILRFCGVSSL